MEAVKSVNPTVFNLVVPKADCLYTVHKPIERGATGAVFKTTTRGRSTCSPFFLLT